MLVYISNVMIYLWNKLSHYVLIISTKNAIFPIRTCTSLTQNDSSSTNITPRNSLTRISSRMCIKNPYLEPARVHKRQIDTQIHVLKKI